VGSPAPGGAGLRRETLIGTGRNDRELTGMAEKQPRRGKEKDAELPPYAPDAVKTWYEMSDTRGTT